MSYIQTVALLSEIDLLPIGSVNVFRPYPQSLVFCCLLQTIKGLCQNVFFDTAPSLMRLSKKAGLLRRSRLPFIVYGTPFCIHCHKDRERCLKWQTLKQIFKDYHFRILFYLCEAKIDKTSVIYIPASS